MPTEHLLFIRLPVVSYPWIFHTQAIRTQAQTFRTQPSGRSVPKSLNVFMQSIRPNNDFEGWHHSLNKRAAGRCGLHFLMFVTLLHIEATLVSLQIRLVSERMLN